MSPCPIVRIIWIYGQINERCYAILGIVVVVRSSFVVWYYIDWHQARHVSLVWFDFNLLPHDWHITFNIHTHTHNMVFFFPFLLSSFLGCIGSWVVLPFVWFVQCRSKSIVSQCSVWIAIEINYILPKGIHHRRVVEWV